MVGLSIPFGYVPEWFPKNLRIEPTILKTSGHGFKRHSRPTLAPLSLSTHQFYMVFDQVGGAVTSWHCGIAFNACGPMVSPSFSNCCSACHDAVVCCWLLLHFVIWIRIIKLMDGAVHHVCTITFKTLGWWYMMPSKRCNSLLTCNEPQKHPSNLLFQVGNLFQRKSLHHPTNLIGSASGLKHVSVFSKSSWPYSYFLMFPPGVTWSAGILRQLSRRHFWLRAALLGPCSRFCSCHRHRHLPNSSRNAERSQRMTHIQQSFGKHLMRMTNFWI